MKKFSKILSIAISVSMIFSMACFTGFADNDLHNKLQEGKNNKSTSGYVAIGDSFTRGFCASEDYEKEIYLNELTEDESGELKDPNCRNVKKFLS